MHPALRAIKNATLQTPFEGQLWLVGGAVRDELLGRPGKSDFDLVTTLDSAKLAQLLHKMGVSTIAPVTYPRFGTAMVMVEGSNIEIVTARKESYDDDSRKPDVEPATLEEDAQRRDFTVNTLMRNLHSWELWDPLGRGLQDLKAKVLRTPLDPMATFYDDPLRMLRAVRFKWTLGFEFADGLETAIRDESGRLEIISFERIRDEFVKMLLLPDADKALDDLMKLGLIDHFAPEFRDMVGVDQGSYHHLDVWDHTRLVVKNAGPGDLTLTLGCLFHDVGKPPTRTVEADGRVRFFGHEVVGADMAVQIMRRLKFSNDDIEPVWLLVKNHMRLGTMDKLTTPAARRLVRDLGEQMWRLVDLVEADANGLKKGVRVLDLDPIREKLREVQVETPAEKLDSPLTGNEIMAALNLEPGPQIGEIKQWLSEKVIEGELAIGDKDSALQMIQRYPLS